MKSRQDTRDHLRPGTNECRCPSCGRYFTGVTSFDMHRIAERASAELRGCLDDKAMRRKGMTKDDKGRWTTGR